MTDTPTISIIMASYNHADFISQAIESVRQQTYDNWELLIADDASTDNTLQVLDAYKNDRRIKIFPFQINRQYHMRNFASKHARGKYLAFLNSDDVFHPEKLQKQIEALEHNKDILTVFTHVSIIDENNNRLKGHSLEKIFSVRNQSRHQWLQCFFISGNCLCVSSAIIRRNCFEEIGRFNPLLIQISDLDLWIRICLRGDIHIIPEELTLMRILRNSKNLSAPSSAVASRMEFENQHIYSHYFSPEAITQASNIFPDLNHTLPEDTAGWRYYLLCSKLIASSHRSMKIAGFTKLHQLLSDREKRISLLQDNPRLLRNLFLWEGSSGLDGKFSRCQWNVQFSNTPSHNCRNIYSSYTSMVRKGTICLSFPNPLISTELCVTVAGKRIPFFCKRFRLYDQLSGKCIFDSIRQTSNQTKIIDLLKTMLLKPRYHIPVINFSKYSSRWIDMEIDCVPIPFLPLVNYVRRIFALVLTKA